MTNIYTFEDMIIIQQLGYHLIDSNTQSQINQFVNEGWIWIDTYKFPEGKRCYVILSKSIITLSPQGAKDIYDALCELYDIGGTIKLNNSSAIWWAIQEIAKYLPKTEPQEEILSQWNIALPYMAELWD